MSLFPSKQIFFKIGNLSVYWYGVIIVCAMIIAYILSAHNFKKNQLDTNDLIDITTWTLIFGVLGARIWYVIFEWENTYKYNPIDIIKINNGGLAIQGGIIFGFIAAYIVIKKKNINFLLAGDCIMPNVLLAQAIGRWGNFINQEAHGTECSLEFLQKLHLPQFIINGMNINGVYYHPTFLYESILNLIGFIFITFIFSRFIKTKGLKFSLYFIWYGLVRIPIEALRTDSLMLGPLKMAQLTSIIFIIIGFIIIFISKKSKKIT